MLMDNLIGQEAIKTQIRMQAEFCTKYNSVFPHTLLIASAGQGKAQPLDSKVLTTTGYIQMKDVVIGTKVIAGNGKATTVLGVYPQGERDIYKVTLSDGSSFEVSDNHLNSVFIYNTNKKIKEQYVMTTLELVDYMKNKDGKGKHLRIEVPTLDCWDHAELPIDPYLMGIIIAEGCIVSNTNHFSISLSEEDIKEKVNTLLGKYGYELRKSGTDSKKVDYRMVQKKHSYNGMGYLQQVFTNYGLRVHSKEKFIPKEYLYTSVENRLNLLRGLFDGDGYTSNMPGNKGYPNYICEYSTASKQLSEDFSFLVRSLGIVDRVNEKQAHYTKNGVRKVTGVAYRHFLKVPNNLVIFSSKKHLSHNGKREFSPVRKIMSVDLIGKKECQCIYVESKEHTYITDNVTVTHNTTMANAIAELIGRPVIHGYCPSIQTKDDLINLFKKNDGSWIEPGSSVFLDEVHQLNLKMAEQLYTIMETFTYAENGVVKSFPKFTLLAGTTEPHMMSKPLRDRFINQFVFEPYTDADIRCFIENMGAVFVMPSAENRIARICNHTPRLVKAFMRKLHMYAVLNNIDMVTSDKLTEYLTASGFTPDGLTPLEDKYMRILADQKKASLATMANLLGMKQNMVATIIEPVLITRGLLEMGVGGRVITEQGKMLYNGRI